MSDESTALVVQAPITATQPSDAKDQAISDLTAACYQKASQLKLNKEEIDGLKADFPDSDFQSGAGGKENLIFIEHAALRERLDSVIGMGQWVLIPIRRWKEDFEYQKDVWENNRRTGKTELVKGSHVYVDAILVIRECFVASAIGEHTYYPENHATNYGDAVESAETAALRRCCKRLGVGLQAWRKDWCAGWWARKKVVKPQFQTPQTRQNAPQQNTPPQGSTPSVKVAPGASGSVSGAPQKRFNAEKTRLKTLNLLQAAPGQTRNQLVTDFLISKKLIVKPQTVMDWPEAHLPKSPMAMEALCEEIVQYEKDNPPMGVTP